MNCLVCGARLEGWWRFCLKCGARIDEATIREVSAIDYLLHELQEWYRREVVDQETQELLEKEYNEKRKQLISGLKPIPKVPTPVDAGFSLEPEFTAKQSPEQPEEIVPPKPFTQVVTDNINLIFMLASLLFVVGILLYYRREIYTGLQIPYVQASVLGLVTIAMLFTGWVLVRQTYQTIAGRALTILGSLLVPINPWFMVRTGILKDSGNSWVLGCICTLLYLWTAYFLKDRLFIYFGLFAGYLTGISLATKLGVFPSYIAGALMLISIVYLLIEGVLAKNEQYSYYAPPFFNTVHIGVLICLMFYTPAIRYLPAEFVAARLHFDPSIYNFSIAFWLSLAATFVYTYSAFRRDRRFIFFAYASLFWGEALLITDYSAPISLYVMIMASSTLFLRYLSDRLEYDSDVKSAVEIGSRASHLTLSLYAVGVHILLFDPRYLPGWTGVAAVGILAFYSLYMLIRERHLLDLAFFWGAAATVVPFASLKGGTAAYWIPVLVMATAAAVLYLIWNESDDREYKFHRVTFLILISLSVIHLCRWAGDLTDQHLAGISTTLILSLLTGLRAWRAPRIEALTLGLLGAVSVTAAFVLVLDLLHLHSRELALMLMAAWSFTIYQATRNKRVRLEMRQSYGAWSTLLNTVILLSTLVLIIHMLGFSYSRYVMSQIDSAYIIVALMLVGGCEVLCVSERRSLIDTLLASASGLLLLEHLLIWLNHTELSMAAFVLLGLCYLTLALYLEQYKYPAKVAFTLELVANLTVTTVAFVTIADGLDRGFTKISLLAPALSTVFYFYGASSTRSRLTAVYCYLTPFYATATLAIVLDIFWIDKLLTLVVYLIPLTLCWYWLDSKVLSVFESRLQTFALWFMPLLILSGCLAIVSENVSKQLVLLFCCELTVFYLYTGMDRKSSLLLSASILSAVFTVYTGLAVVGWDEYTLGFIAIFTVVLSHLSLSLKGRLGESLCQVLDGWVRGLFLLDTGLITVYAISEMRMSNQHLNEVIANLLLVKVSWLILRFTAVDESVKSAYRSSVIYLTTMTYLLIGLRLGFDFWKQNEFYSVPVGLLYLTIGIVRRGSVQKSVWWMIWIGSFTTIMPMLLHTLSFRFIDRHPSSIHEIGVVVLSLVLILTGVVFQLKAPTLFGAASLAICLFCIVFGFVGWEQRWFSITLIVLGASIFIVAWLIYYFSKGKERLDEGKRLLEEFGKWK